MILNKLIFAISILNPAWCIGIRYRAGECARISTKLRRYSRNGRGREGPRTRYIVVGSTCAHRISMFRNSDGIHSLSHLRRFQPSMPLFMRRCGFLYKSFTFFPRNLTVFTRWSLLNFNTVNSWTVRENRVMQIYSHQDTFSGLWKLRFLKKLSFNSLLKIDMLRNVKT